jgi:hypothetical protein
MSRQAAADLLAGLRALIETADLERKDVSGHVAAFQELETILAIEGQPTIADLTAAGIRVLKAKDETRGQREHMRGLAYRLTSPVEQLARRLSEHAMCNPTDDDFLQQEDRAFSRVRAAAEELMRVCNSVQSELTICPTSRAGA